MGGNMEYDSFYYHIFTNFYKVSSDYKVLKGERYELVSYDKGIRTGIFTEERQDGILQLLSDSYTTNHLTNEQFMNLLPSVLSNKLNNISSIDDINDFQNQGEAFIVERNNSSNGNVSISISFKVPFKLEQVKTSPGTQKKDIVFIGSGYINYSFDNNDTLIRSRYSFNSSNGSYYSVLYNTDFPTINSLSDLSLLTNQSIEEACVNQDSQGKIITDHNECSDYIFEGSGQYSLVPYFVSQQGNIKLEIKESVNSLTKYNASKNKSLNYRVIVDNTGNASSSNNVITTYVPKEISVVNNTISHNGTYNKQNNTITWKIDHLEGNDHVELHYRAIAPSKTSGKDLMSHSTIKSDQVTTAVQSNTTIVTLDRIIEIIENPNTGSNNIYIPNTNIGMPLSLLFVITLVVGITTFLFIKIFKRKKNTNILEIS